MDRTSLTVQKSNKKNKKIVIEYRRKLKEIRDIRQYIINELKSQLVIATTTMVCWKVVVVEISYNRRLCKLEEEGEQPED